ARLNIGNAGVRMDACGLATDLDLTVDPTEVEPGESTAATGTGFTPDSTATVELIGPDGEPVGEPVNVDTDGNGEFTVDLPVPADAAPGDYIVRGTDETSGDQVETALVVLESGGLDLNIGLDPPEVAPGESTTVTGEGFTPDATASVQLVNPAGEPVGEPVPAETDGDGGFTVDLPVPEGAEPGDFTVVGSGDESGESAEAPLTVAEGDGGVCPVEPAVTVDPTSALPGETVTVSGEGFAPGTEASVQLTDAEGNPVGEPVTAPVGEDCTFETEFTIPEDTEPGDHDIGAEDPDGNEDPRPIEIVEPGAPAIAVEPSEVAPGESTTVIGEGFTPDATASVQLGNPAGEPVGEPVPAETDGDGGFTVDLPVPEGAEPGDFTVVGTDDESGESAEAPLTVTEGDGGVCP